MFHCTRVKPFDCSLLMIELFCFHSFFTATWIYGLIFFRPNKNFRNVTKILIRHDFPFANKLANEFIFFKFFYRKNSIENINFTHFFELWGTEVQIPVIYQSISQLYLLFLLNGRKSKFNFVKRGFKSSALHFFQR